MLFKYKKSITLPLDNQILWIVFKLYDTKDHNIIRVVFLWLKFI